jgi:hypothetical protein
MWQYGKTENVEIHILSARVRIILKWTCERLDGGAWTGSIWLRIGTGGGLS